jgi:hypothetical protein
MFVGFSILDRGLILDDTDMRPGTFWTWFSLRRLSSKLLELALLASATKRAAR